MKQLFFLGMASMLLVFCCWQNPPLLRTYTSANVHAHNDYEQPIPFFAAYKQRVGSIEADVFLQNGELYVAHEPQAIKPDRTLETLYLKPLQAAVKKNNGTAYPPPSATLQLLIDVKTEGETTLPVLIKILARYPEISANSTVRVVISGNRPAPATWPEYPSYIYFDGRPDEEYTPAALNRVALISDNFRKYTRWNGKGIIAENEQRHLQQLIKRVHQLNKNIRFWATPDDISAWKALTSLNVDFLGTDEVTALTNYLQNPPAATQQNTK